MNGVLLLVWFVFGEVDCGIVMEQWASHETND